MLLSVCNRWCSQALCAFLALADQESRCIAFEYISCLYFCLLMTALTVLDAFVFISHPLMELFVSFKSYFFIFKLPIAFDLQMSCQPLNSVEGLVVSVIIRLWSILPQLRPPPFCWPFYRWSWVICFPFFCHLFHKRTFDNKLHRLIMTLCPFCHPSNSIKALQQTVCEEYDYVILHISFRLRKALNLLIELNFLLFQKLNCSLHLPFLQYRRFCHFSCNKYTRRFIITGTLGFYCTACE